MMRGWRAAEAVWWQRRWWQRHRVLPPWARDARSSVSPLRPATSGERLLPDKGSGRRLPQLRVKNPRFWRRPMVRPAPTTRPLPFQQCFTSLFWLRLPTPHLLIPFESDLLPVATSCHRQNRASTAIDSPHPPPPPANTAAACVRWPTSLLGSRGETADCGPDLADAERPLWVSSRRRHCLKRDDPIADAVPIG